MEAHEKKIMAARTSLVLDQPFFGVLALRLRIAADSGCPTAWVDGRTLGYNPSFVASLSHAQLTALIAHEVMHCACGHPWRRDQRDQKRWNGACDYAINSVLEDAGFSLPEGGLLDRAYASKSAEWIYDRLPKAQDGGDGEQGNGPSAPSDEDSNDDGTPACSDGEGTGSGEDKGEGTGSPQGEVRDAPADATEDGSTEADWSAAVQQAANAAKAQGKLSGDLERFASDAAQPQVDWRSALRRFVQETAATDYTWRQPSPRYVARGLYLPKLHSEEMGPMVVALDTSGSIDEVLLAQFEAEIRAIVAEANPQRVHVMYCDAKVQRIDTFEQGDLIEFDPVGGGGTAFAPVFDAIDELDEVPACVVYLTDLRGSFPADVPEVPTLWATTCEREVPFGEVLPIQ